MHTVATTTETDPANLPAPIVNEQSTLELIQQLHDGVVRAEDLSADLRRDCVEHLTQQGFSNADIASLLKVSERCVRRDREALRAATAIAPTLELSDELLGEFHQVTLTTIQRLARLARDTSAPPYSRLWAEEAISRAYDRFLARAQRMGYLEDGSVRLRRLRASDTSDLARFAQRHQAVLDALAPRKAKRRSE